MDVFDRIREKSKFISFLVRLQNTALYPILFAIVCAFSGVNGKEVYLPCIYILSAVVIITGLFASDLKVFFVPFILFLYSVGLDVAEGYYKEVNPRAEFDISSVPHFVICGLLIISVMVYKLASRGLLREMFIKRGMFFWGIILLDAALLIGGIFSGNFGISSVLWALMFAVVLTFCYFLFSAIVQESADCSAYLCKILVSLGYAVMVQILITTYRLHINNHLIFVDMRGVKSIMRGVFNLSWGLSTIIGAVLAVALFACMYLMRNRRFPILSCISAVLFFLGSVFLNTRSSILIGGLIFIIGLILNCFGCKNKICNRFSVLAILIVGALGVTVFIRSFPDTYKSIIAEALKVLRLNFNLESIETLSTNRITIWKEGIANFISEPLFGVGINKGYPISGTVSVNIFNDMYHNVIIQMLASCGMFGIFALVMHLKHLLEVTVRCFSADRLLLMLVPLGILTMSLFDNFFFYPNFMIIYTAALACAEKELTVARNDKLLNLKNPSDERAVRVVFAYVEAGKGHIVPAKNVCESFKCKCGDRVEVIESYFFTETGSEEMKKTESLFRRAVQAQGRSPLLGYLCKIGNLLAGDTFALFVLLRMTLSGRKTNKPAVKHIEELDADIIYTAHWSIPFYVNQIKGKRPYTVCFCPDVYSNGAFNVDCNEFLISSDVGYRQVAERRRMYAGGNISKVAFPIRNNMDLYKSEQKKHECREKLGIPDGEFVAVLCDGGYGMARMGQTAKHLLERDVPMTVIALCGTNHKLYEELSDIANATRSRVRLIAVSFTESVLDYVACADVFAGKSGASSMAEPTYLGIPIIITKCITYIERGIKNYYVKKLGCALYLPSAGRAADRIVKFAQDRELLKKYIKTDLQIQRYDAEESADILCRIAEEMSK